jgi:hypothetical protein
MADRRGEELDELAVEGQLEGDEEGNVDNPEGEGYSRDTGDQAWHPYLRHRYCIAIPRYWYRYRYRPIVSIP